MYFCLLSPFSIVVADLTNGVVADLTAVVAELTAVVAELDVADSTCRRLDRIPVSVTDNSNLGAVGIPYSPSLPCDMEKSTIRTNRNAQSTPLTFKSRADRIMTVCNRS